MLNQIGGTDVHKITSGQVIVDLLSVVKELVENSIDANARTVEITFKEHGLESIEVNDNGDGIGPEDYESLCMKHYTSKITTFEDLDTVKTLGFRGEALSSICANARVTIVTSTAKQVPYSTELEYDHLGRLKKHQLVLNKRTEKGTRIVVQEIFKSLPVRYKNLCKNIKREFNKMLQFLYSYIIINPGIKFSVNNIVNDKRKNLIVTNKSASVLNNMIIIYGTKSVESLHPINLRVSDTFRVEGYISSISIGRGRSLKDKQFLYLNKRPIINKDISKVINETYNGFNNLQYPVYVLNMIITDEMDVNINPNKTLVNFNQDLAKLRQKFCEYWEQENSQQYLNRAPQRPETGISNKRPSVHEQENAKKPFSVNERAQGKEQENGKNEQLIEAKYKPKLNGKKLQRKTLRFGNYCSHNYKVKIRVDKDSLIPKKRAITEEPQAENKKNEEPQEDVTDNVTKEITVKKLEFGQMKLIGQFNLGFILTKLDDNVFIVDQHASDEKYNYETLKNEFKVKNQLLIKPIKLNLSLIEKNHLQNEDMQRVIEKNGFRINDKLELTHLPIYKNFQFDETDLIELISQPQEIVCKVNKILAMKACRKSIMIGQHLTPTIMARVLKNLTTLDKPWNCPHGRPTVRYLYKLKRRMFEEDYVLDRLNTTEKLQDNENRSDN